MSVENENNKDYYSEVVLSKVDPEKELPVDIYIYLNDKFIKFRSKGDPIGQDKFELFIAKGVNKIFIQSDEIMNYLDWLNEQNLQEERDFVDQFGEENRGFFKRSKDFKEKVYDVFFEKEITTTVIKQLQENVADFVDEIKSNSVTEQAIALMQNKNTNVADHSINVANIAIFIGMVLGHGHQFILENIYMGSLFHDYGKLKIDPNLLDQKGDRLYSQAIQDHPINGTRLLEKTEGIPAQVFVIVQQHHEQFNGYGYPKGLSGDEIYELSQIVSMANVFDNTLREHNKLPKNERYRRAIKILEYDRGKMWNPKYIGRVVEAFTALIDAIEDNDKMAS